MKLVKKCLMLGLIANLLGGCASSKLAPIATVPQVDLKRFMGDWYVIAAIPTAIEKESYNAVENYQLNKDGTIATTFTFNQGSFEGKLKTYRPRGFVVENTGNARWGMQFIWPIKAEFLIAHLDDQYTETIIARNARDYVWIMARSPDISTEAYTALVEKIRDMGYDIQQLRKVPHQPKAKP